MSPFLTPFIHVRAGLVKQAEEYEWSSARAHALNGENKYLSDNFAVEEIKDWKEYLSQSYEGNDLKNLRKHSSTGRPMGDDKFIEVIEESTSRILRKKKPGRKVKEN